MRPLCFGRQGTAMMMRRYMIIVMLLFVVAADSISKVLMKALIVAGGPMEVTPFLNLILVMNKGVAFGFLAESAPSQHVMAFLGFIISVGFVIGAWLERSHARSLALSAIAGGGMANALDRLLNGAVIDFIDVHGLGWHFPAFNLADSAITLGVIAYLFFLPKS